MKKVLIFVLTIFFSMFSFDTVYALTGDEIIEKAVQETAYAYYMRGMNIQYNTVKRSGGSGIKSIFAAEEATSQNMQYTVCSGFTANVYYNMLNIAIESYTDGLISYGKKYIDDGQGLAARPEVIMYASKSNETLNMKYKDTNGSVASISNPTITNVLPLLKAGDVITYTGHTMLVYKLIKNSNNVTTDAYIMQSSGGHSGRRINIKNLRVNARNVVTMDGDKTIGSYNHYFYYNNFLNESQEVIEGTISFDKLSTTAWYNLGTSSDENSEYTILRPLTVSKNGDIVLNYKSSNIIDNKKTYDNYAMDFTNSAKNRIKFSKLYIEKTVDKHDNNAVDFGQNLTYTIKVKNNSTSKYTEDLIIEEEISDLVTYKSYEVVKGSNVTFSDRTKKQWNIGKLAVGEEVIIKYTVQVKKGNYGKIIVSKGTVGNIPNTVVENEINKTLSSSQKELLKTKYNELKGTYKSRELIEEIYKQALGVTLNLSSLKIYNIDNSTASGYLIKADESDFKNGIQQIYGDAVLNKDHKFSSMVLNKYWSSMQRYTGDIVDKNWENITATNKNIYVLRYWKGYDEDIRRADTIYGETFQTGDILMYYNQDDESLRRTMFGVSNTTITNEYGYYAYIYIEGLGFVGDNVGATSYIKDNRDSYTYNYYDDNGLKVFCYDSLCHDENYPGSPDSNGVDGNTYAALYNATSVKEKEFGNYQALLGKDYYVILRPAQMSKLKTIQKDDDTGDSPYAIDYGNNVIYKLDNQIDASNIHTLFEDNFLSMTVKDKQNSAVNSGSLYTGYKIVTTFGNTDESTYTLSVQGDTLGNGVNTESAKNIARHIINKNIITSKESLYAADYDSNGVVKMNDVVKILKAVS